MTSDNQDSVEKALSWDRPDVEAYGRKSDGSWGVIKIFGPPTKEGSIEMALRVLANEVRRLREELRIAKK